MVIKLAKTKNAVMEINKDGTATVIDMAGVVRVVPDARYETGQIVYLDVEAIDLMELSDTEEDVDRAIAGDVDVKIISFPERAKRGVARRAFPIAASLALALIFGVGGSVYANGEIAETVERDGVSYDMNYFHRVIGVHVDDVDDEELLELKRDLRGMGLDEAERITGEKLPDIVTSEKPDTSDTHDDMEEIDDESDDVTSTQPKESTDRQEESKQKRTEPSGTQQDAAAKPDTAAKPDVPQESDINRQDSADRPKQDEANRGQDGAIGEDKPADKNDGQKDSDDRANDKPLDGEKPDDSKNPATQNQPDESFSAPRDGGQAPADEPSGQNQTKDGGDLR